jgi:hypothetical protein
LQAAADLGLPRGRAGTEPLQHLLELPLQDSKIGDLRAESVQVFRHQLLEPRAQRPARPAIEISRQGLELAEGEPERPCATDEQGPMHIPLRILAVPADVAAGSGQHPDRFVVANRLGRQAGGRRELANGQCPSHHDPPPSDGYMFQRLEGQGEISPGRRRT